MKTAFFICLCFFLAGCTTARLSTRSLEAEERIVTGIEKELLLDGRLQKVRIICPEPSPDALKTIAASGSASKADIANISAAYQESGANIGLRTQSIQLLRDQLFSICQAYANGAISNEMYQMYLTRNQRNTVAILAIEQLTGAVRGPNVVLNSSSSTADSHYLMEQASIIKEAKTKLAAMKADSDEAKTMQSNIKAMEEQLKQTQEKMVQTTSTGSSNTIIQTPDTKNSVIAIAGAVERITEMTTWTNDLFYICLNSYANLPPNRRPPELNSACGEVYKNLAQASLYQLNNMINAPAQSAPNSAAPTDPRDKPKISFPLGFPLNHKSRIRMQVDPGT
ncbi:hypothetical protein ACIPQ1_20360 [Pseudomonas sp. LARHCG127]